VGRRAREAQDEAPLSEPDAFRFTTIAHAGLDVLGPVSVGTVDALLASVPAGAGVHARHLRGSAARVRALA
jgi:hypothetical protein